MPPTARNASRLFGFRNLFICPGVNAKQLLSRLKSPSVPGYGFRASIELIEDLDDVKS